MKKARTWGFRPNLGLFGLGFGVSGLWCRVSGVGVRGAGEWSSFSAHSLRLRGCLGGSALGFREEVQGLVWGFVWVGFGVWGLLFCVKGLEFGVLGVGGWV